MSFTNEVLHDTSLHELGRHYWYQQLHAWRKRENALACRLPVPADDGGKDSQQTQNTFEGRNFVQALRLHKEHIGVVQKQESPPHWPRWR